MSSDFISADDLATLEADVTSALGRRDHSGLSILGFGEISVALGYPSDRPRFACKRTPPFTRSQFEDYRGLVEHYVAELDNAGLSVVDTRVLAVERGDKLVAYLVQPLLDATTLGHEVLRRSEPDPEQPFLLALGRTLEVVTDRISLDGQVTNWSWDGEQMTLLDVGTPFLWDRSGGYRFDMTPYLTMIPAPFRGSARKELTTMVDRWREPRGVALDIVSNLFREGLTQWVPPTIIALNTAIGPSGTISVEEARDVYAEDLKTWPRLARLKRVERAWQTRVRRRHYDFFIQTTFGDAVY